ncbi:MAG TPA: hypothetical protein VKP13_18185 [Nitrospira sp.]|nr:hypothetical protein [Nitrospira sp.]
MLMLAPTFSWIESDPATAHRELFTPEEKERVKAAERIHVDAVALTDMGAVDAAAISSVASARLRAVGYTVVTDPAQPHDVTVKIKCEEHQVWEGPIISGGDTDQLYAASRLWNGPACLITYRIDNHASDWRMKYAERSQKIHRPRQRPHLPASRYSQQ